MNRVTCEFCNLSVKDKYTLKTHLVRNKTCLKTRGLTLNTNFVCNGCNNMFSTNLNLTTHIDTCKKYIILKVREDCKEECKSEYCTQINKLKEQLKEPEIITYDNNQVTNSNQ